MSSIDAEATQPVEKQLQLPDYYSVTLMGLVSANEAGIAGNARSPSQFEASALSRDGSRVAFSSSATTLVDGGSNGWSQYFVKELDSGQVYQASTASDGSEGTFPSVGTPATSADGRYVAFMSEAANLVAGAPIGSQSIFRKDLQTGQTILVSRAANGTVADAVDPASLAISGDGRYVVFATDHPALVGQYGGTQLVRKDLVTGAVQVVSASAAGTYANSFSVYASMSEDGRYVAFGSYADNLVAGDVGGFGDVFRKDLLTGDIELVSRAVGGGFGNDLSLFASISADGRHVAFASWADDLVAGDSNGWSDVFVRDMVTGEIELVSRSMQGAQGDEDSSDPEISADGRHVTFHSWADGLVADDANGYPDVFVHDRETGALTLVSRAANGAPYGGVQPSISGDGSLVTFVTPRPLSAGDSNGFEDIYFATLLANDLHLIGTDAADTLRGGDGADTLEGLAGDDSLVGGQGVDTVVYPSPFTDFAPYVGPGWAFVVLTDVFAGLSGSDTVVGIERVEFSDTGFALDVDLGEQAHDALSLLTAAFGTAAVADKGLLGATLADFGRGLSMEQVAQAIIDAHAPPGFTTDDLIYHLYFTITGRMPGVDEVAWLQGLGMTDAQLYVLGAGYADDFGLFEEVVQLGYVEYAPESVA